MINKPYGLSDEQIVEETDLVFDDVRTSEIGRDDKLMAMIGFLLIELRCLRRDLDCFKETMRP